MERCQNIRLKKHFLSTRKKMRILSAINSDSKKCLCENDSESEKDCENIYEHGKLIMAILKNEQYYVECLKQLKKLLVHPILKANIDSLDDIARLVDEMLSVHSNFYGVLVDGKSDLSETLKRISSNVDTYVSYSVLINLELNKFQSYQKLCSDNGMNVIDLLHEPLIQIARYKTLFNNLYRTLPEEMYFNALRAVENASEKIKNASVVKKNAVRMLQIQRLLVGRQPKILHPGRSVLKEGILYKVKCQGNGLKKRAFFLFTDVLLCCKLLSNTYDYHEKDSLLFCALFPLDVCSVDFVLGSSASNGALFKVTCGTISYLLLSKIPGESQKWVQELQTAISSCQKLSPELKPKLNRWRNINVKQRISPFIKKTYKPSENVTETEHSAKGKSTDMSTVYFKTSKYKKFVKFITCIKE